MLIIQLFIAGLAIKQNKKLFAVPGPIYSLNSSGPNGLIKNGAKLITSANDVLNELGLQFFQAKQSTVEAESPGEKLILDALKDEPLHVDKIIERTKLNASTVAGTLALMEVSGKIRSLKANTYSLN